MPRRRRLLVADDEPQVQLFLKPSLTASNFDVVQATAGADAIAAFARQAPDLVLLDLGLADDAPNGPARSLGPVNDARGPDPMYQREKPGVPCSCSNSSSAC